MRCVVVIGIGIVFFIGVNIQEVLVSFWEGKFGISFVFDYVEYGFCSQVYGMLNVDILELIDKCQFCFMGDGVVYNYIVM